MYKFSSKSLEKLDTVHPDLQTLAHEALKIMDCTVVSGVRTTAEQRALFEAEPPLTKTMNSKHLRQADNYAHAVDLAPYVNGGIPWKDLKYFYRLAGVMEKTAQMMRIDIRWGGDWNMNDDLNDQEFRDLPHFELL